jgi:hypothetical protein
LSQRRNIGLGRREGIARAEGSSAMAVRKMEECMMKAGVCRGITMLVMTGFCFEIETRWQANERATRAREVNVE